MHLRLVFEQGRIRIAGVLWGIALALLVLWVLVKLVFGIAGALDVWVGIITGLALGLSPALSGSVSIASALVGVTLVVAVGCRT